jgi:hypothetical protein
VGHVHISRICEGDLVIQEIPLQLCGLAAPLPSSVRVNLGSSLLVLKQGFPYKLNVYLRLNAFYAAPNFYR